MAHGDDDERVDHGNGFDDDDGLHYPGPSSAEEPAWNNALHNVFVDEYIGGYYRCQRLSAAALREQADVLERLCAEWSECCPQCHYKEPHAPASSGGSRIVTLVSVGIAVDVAVPIKHCSKCDKNFHASPLALGYFPATLKEALDLTTAKQIPIWFDLEFLKLLDSLQVGGRPPVASVDHVSLSCWAGWSQAA